MNKETRIKRIYQNLLTLEQLLRLNPTVDDVVDAQMAVSAIRDDLQCLRGEKARIVPLNEWIAMYSSGSATSKAAADALSKGYLRGRERRIWDYLLSCGSQGATDDAMTHELQGVAYKDGVARGLISGRNHLVQKGCVFETGELRESLDSGRLVSVWAVTPYSEEMRKQGRW